MPRASTKTAAMAKPGAFISCRQGNRKSWIMISNEMRAERGMDSFFLLVETADIASQFYEPHSIITPRASCRTPNGFEVKHLASARWLRRLPSVIHHPG